MGASQLGGDQLVSMDATWTGFSCIASAPTLPLSHSLPAPCVLRSISGAWDGTLFGLSQTLAVGGRAADGNFTMRAPL